MKESGKDIFGVLSDIAESDEFTGDKNPMVAESDLEIVDESIPEDEYSELIRSREFKKEATQYLKLKIDTFLSDIQHGRRYLKYSDPLSTTKVLAKICRDYSEIFKEKNVISFVKEEMF
jgi:hypothetical protein